jgi:MHS family proline/betaine transporter-like MFS transporter
MLLGAGFGNFIEWYDFAAYGFVAVFIGRVFFPNADEVAQLLSSFAVFGVSFFVRPLGALFFGPLCDRIGRKRVLVIVLTIMAITTFAIGALPGYAQIGILAPTLLVILRCVQGFSAGGEFGTNTTFIAEHAAPSSRGLSASLVPASATSGVLVGGLVVFALESSIGAAAMEDWGWRIPFLIAGPLGLIGLYIRLALEDTPEFHRLEASGAVETKPLRAVLAHKRGLGITAAITVLYGVSYYFLVTYLSTFLSRIVGFTSTQALLIVLLGGVVALITFPIAGALSDRIGRRRVLMTSAMAHILFGVPLFLLIGTGNLFAAVAGTCILALIMAPFVAVSISTMAELFPAPVRATGISLGFNIPIAAFGGLAPFVATFLIERTQMTFAPAIYLIVAAAVSAVGLLFLTPQSLTGAADRDEATKPTADNQESAPA